MSSTHRYAAVVAVAICAGLLAGCSHGGSAAATPTTTLTPGKSLAGTMVHGVLTQRTARVSVDVSTLAIGEATRLAGTVDYGPDAIKAELSGKVEEQPVRMIVVGSTMYVSGLTTLPAGKVWQRSTVGAQRPFASWWTVLDQASTSLTHASDECLMTGLQYNGAPPEDLDGTTVRASVVTVSRERFVEKLPETQKRSYDAHFVGFTGARMQVYLDQHDLPRQLIVTLTGDQAYPAVVVRYSAWGTATSIAAPTASQVVDATAA